jgi:hypothetical protein
MVSEFTYGVLWNLAMVFLIFIMYASLTIAVFGIMAFRAVNRGKKTMEEAGDEEASSDIRKAG